ncbi:MAG: hypothetical protein ISS78_06090 [Phycisphaerae bacterium]|nr:hypothetical protein [Phycisphaerae bacterium]
MPKGRDAPDPTDAGRSVAQGRCASRGHRDLCSTCSHAETCGNRSTPQRPIFFCEMFDVLAPPPVVTPAAASARTRLDKPAVPPAARQDAGQYKGLCVNCENRNTCILPRPEGEIWHCQEYR